MMNAMVAKDILALIIQFWMGSFMLVTVGPLLGGTGDVSGGDDEESEAMDGYSMLPPG